MELNSDAVGLDKILISKSTTFRDACNKVAELLPPGWQIRIELEHNSGCIILEDENYEEVDFPTNHEFIDETLNDALEYAIEQSKLETENGVVS